mgnify:CR=1 FL=1
MKQKVLSDTEEYEQILTTAKDITSPICKNVKYRLLTILTPDAKVDMMTFLSKYHFMIEPSSCLSYNRGRSARATSGWQ